MKKIIRMVLNGIAFGCTISCMISIIGYQMIGNEWFLLSPRGFTKQVLAAVLVGIGFTLPSIVYDNERLSFLQKIVIHLSIGLIIYIPTAFYMGWLPGGSPGKILLQMLLAALISLIIWICFYLYYKNMAKEMTKKIKEKNKKT